MLLIVAHHYVVNSGLLQTIQESDNIVNACAMLILVAWGKTGINCFLLITGYFMCKSAFSIKKLLKLYLEIAFYTIGIYVIFCITGREDFSSMQLLWKVWPVKSISMGFTSCFVAFYLFILSVIIAVSSFMYFKDLKLPQSRIINAVGASTFGVLLIHANSDVMRQWLWKETIDCSGHFGDSVVWTLGYALAAVLLIFVVCADIDLLRARFIESKMLDLVYKKTKIIFPRFQVSY